MAKESLKKHVEGKIFKGYMIISNLSEEEFKQIDDFCKATFEDNRRQMLLNLIRYYDGDTAVRLLDDKLYLIYDDINSRLETVEKVLLPAEAPQEAEKLKNIWKGFKSE